MTRRDGEEERAAGQGPGRGPRVIDGETEHAIKNHLAILAGYCDLLLADTPADDQRHRDLDEMNRSIRALVAIFRTDLRA
jgi:hypothetical protein